MSGSYTPAIINTSVSAGVPIAVAAAKGAALTVPVVGAVIAGVTLAVNIWLSSVAKKNAQKSATTQIVNQAEEYMRQNLAAFQSLAQPTESERAAALANFNAIWQQAVVEPCSNGPYDDAGRRCVSDRSRGGQWDWFSYYYDPIANAETVPDAFGTSDGTSGGGLLAGGSSGLLLPILLIVGGLFLAGGQKS